MQAVLTVPTLTDVYAARERVYRAVRPTPLMRHPLFARETGLDVFVKHENHNPTCAFKVRGGLNLIGSLPPSERHGVITATTGNHGQSIALACQREGVPCTIVVPLGNNPEKNAAMRAYGADVIEHGRDFDEAREKVEALQHERGLRYVHSANEPLLIAGVGTYALEIFEELPDVDVIVVPIGGGSGAAGACVVAKAIRPEIEVIGVQSEAAPAAFRSWQAHGFVEDETATFAEGLATRVPFELPQQILWEHLDDFVLVSEDEIREATRLMIEHTRNLVEPAGAAPLAAAFKLADRFRGRRIALIASGGNISPAQLAALYG